MFLLLTANDGFSSTTDICVHSDIPTLCLNRQLHNMFLLLTAKDGTSFATAISVLMKVCTLSPILRDNCYMAVVRTIGQTPTQERPQLL